MNDDLTPEQRARIWKRIKRRIQIADLFAVCLCFVGLALIYFSKE